MTKLRVAVHKFTSCDGCQLALLNLGPTLLAVAERFELVHFAEAGPVDPDAHVDVALIEGSISTPDEEQRIRRIRTSARHLVAIGACANSGGIQALRNLRHEGDWVGAIYASPQHIETLKMVRAIGDVVTVDLELWGCPVTSAQVLAALRALAAGVVPADEADKVCLECKRMQTVCVMVTRQIACMGPVTRTGCGAICPRFGRDCYGCFGPAETANTDALSRRLMGLGLPPRAVARRYHFIHGAAPVFAAAGDAAQEHGHG
ncbi:MAG TPA: sulfhydrogenase subunit delta [Burkholderiaceae bacterium]|nr:sulfhydrogenase subunit delta [Burkholderiaceae bacterium]